MASGFPASIDNFTDPLSNSPLNSPSHSALHTNVNDAVEKIETYMGLVYITGNTFSITNAAPLNLDNVFTALYDNYLLTTQNVTSAAGTTSVLLQWRVGGVTTTAGYFLNYMGYTSAGATYNTGSNGGGVGIDVALAETAAGSGSSAIQIMTPKTTGQAAAYGQLFAQGPGFYVTRQGGGALNAGTDFDGFTLRASASTITGSYRLYGYRK